MENGNCASIPPERPAVTITQEGAEIKVTFRRVLVMAEWVDFLIQFDRCSRAAEMYAATH
jgi:hypothetical protein